MVVDVLKDKAEFTREAVFALREGHGKKVEQKIRRDGFLALSENISS